MRYLPFLETLLSQKVSQLRLRSWAFYVCQKCPLTTHELTNLYWTCWALLTDFSFAIYKTKEISKAQLDETHLGTLKLMKCFGNLSYCCYSFHQGHLHQELSRLPQFLGEPIPGHLPVVSLWQWLSVCESLREQDDKSVALTPFNSRVQGRHH